MTRAATGTVWAGLATVASGCFTAETVTPAWSGGRATGSADAGGQTVGGYAAESLASGGASGTCGTTAGGGIACVPPPPTTAGRGNDGNGCGVPCNVCIPGVTQECLGPGRCAGAHACNSTGTGWEVCDCGTGGGASAGSPASDGTVVSSGQAVTAPNRAGAAGASSESSNGGAGA